MIKQIVAATAAVLVVAGLAFAFEHSAIDAAPSPRGEVVVTDLGVESSTTLAQASNVDSLGAVESAAL